MRQHGRKTRQEESFLEGLLYRQSVDAGDGRKHTLVWCRSHWPSHSVKHVEEINSHDAKPIGRCWEAVGRIQLARTATSRR